MGTKLSIRSSKPFMKCGPGTIMSDGTIRASPGVCVQPQRMARPPKIGANQGGDEGQRQQAEMASAQFLPGCKTQPCGHAGDECGSEVGAEQAGETCGSASQHQNDGPARMPRSVRLDALQLFERRRRLQFAAANLAKDCVNARLDRRVEAKFRRRHDQRAVRPQGNCQAAVRNRNFDILAGSAPWRSSRGRGESLRSTRCTPAATGRLAPTVRVAGVATPYTPQHTQPGECRGYPNAANSGEYRTSPAPTAGLSAWLL